MPRNHIDIPDQIEYLSVLDEDGNLDAALEPELSPEMLTALHQTMLLGRRFDERMLSLQRQGRIGTFPPISGQEAAHLGAVSVLRPTDWFVPAFRETAAELWRGRPMENVILYYGGFNEGGRIEEDQYNLPVSIPVASQIIHAVGLGWSIGYRQKDDIAMVFFGDGATSEGDFHEGLNFAGVFKTPVIFVCQNNQWAISIPRSRQTISRTLAQKAMSYGIPGIQVDGNDILAMVVAAREAAARARSGGGPTLIEAVTYRLTVHTTADDPKRYRTDAEVDAWKKRDPLPRFQNYLIQKNVLNSDKIEAAEAAVKAKIQAAVTSAEEKMKSMTDPMQMFDHLYADMPPELEEQYRSLAAAQTPADKEAGHG